VPGAGQPPGIESIGGKGRQLAQLAALARASGFEVPRFAVVEAGAFVAQAETVAARADDPRAALLAAPLPPGLESAIEGALAEAGLSGRRLAVRSSAAGEDSAQASFAGQFDSVLGVDGSSMPAVTDAVRRVWASAFHAHARAYEGARGGAGVRMAVILQAMVDPRASGVAFAADPVSGARDTAVVSAVYGLGEGLVSGALDADTWHVPAGAGELQPAIVRKDRAVRMTAGGGTAFVPVPEDLAARPALTDDEVRRLAVCVRGLSERLGGPQDVEWAVVDEPGGARLVLLQTRPITTLGPAAVAPPAAPADTPDGPGRRVWDNSNIIESYSGVTTPLTFTFARAVYEDVYRQFCRIMGVAEAQIAAHEDMFARMLGLVRGRVYYSLINWYRLVALLPGFTWNRGFMERMMGVREALEAPPPPPDTGSRMRDFLSLLRMLLRMLRAHGGLVREVPAFHARIEAELAPLAGADLTTWPEARIVELYRRLERELLGHWRAPLVNDFFAMIFFGVLGRLCERWLPGAPATLVNDLLSGEGGIVSTEPARRVMAIARDVAADPVAAAAFRDTQGEALWARLREDPRLERHRVALEGYVEAFGDRCLEELKLETVTLREDPSFLLNMVRAYTVQGAIDPQAALEHERSIRRAAEARADAALGWPKRVVFRWVLARARARVRDRENLRFERTRVFGVVRRMLLGLGTALERRGALAGRRDVFWLTIDEALEAGAGVDVDGFEARVAERRAVFAAWSAGPAPPDRFETTGPLGPWAGPREEEIPGAAAGGAVEGDLRGTGCCPGVVRAPVRIVRDPREAVALEGCILVAERTDPGWTLLFPAVRGLLVQRGSLLSHSAIVAREMGIPAVVGIAGLLDTLADGEVVEMDGATGIVRRGVEAA